MTENKNTIDPLQEMFNASMGTQTPQNSSNGNFVVSYPKSLEDIQSLISGLKSNNSALVNFCNAPKTLIQRMIDFLSGACFALDASISKIMEGQYLVTVSGVSIKVNK